MGSQTLAREPWAVGLHCKPLTGSLRNSSLSVQHAFEGPRHPWTFSAPRLSEAWSFCKHQGGHTAMFPEVETGDLCMTTVLLGLSGFRKDRQRDSHVPGIHV